MSTRDIPERVDHLVKNFPRYLEVFTNHCPFSTHQLECHRAALAERAKFESASEALRDRQFVEHLRVVLTAWKQNGRGSHLVDPVDFAESLLHVSGLVSEMQEQNLDELSCDTEQVAGRLWIALCILRLGTQGSHLVLGTKALHHVLPDLVVPMDNAYTKAFLSWSTQFYSNEGSVFRRSFRAFREVALSAEPRQYVGPGWNTSITKVIDNAIIGYCLSEL